MFDSPARLLLGLLTGFLFGFLLQKGQVAKFHVIVGQFLLRDFTVMKVMLTAVVAGGVGVHILTAAGAASLHVKPALMAGVVAGAVIFAFGMVLLGYCPGTCVAAMGEGSRSAIAGFLGMLAGAALFAEVYPALRRTILPVADLGPATLPSLTGISAWGWLAMLAIAAVFVFRWLERWEAGRAARRQSQPLVR